MAEISIPGVSDKYKTNDLVKSLMEVERIPLNREQASLDNYKTQQEAWRRVNQNMTALRDSARSLYSYDNPFVNKTASSTEEGSVTAVPGRGAANESFKIDVIALAEADRFLSGELEKNSAVPEGAYTFSVGEKSITLNWKGGKLADFAGALNRRGAGLVKAALIGVSGAKQSLMIESLKTGAENGLSFKDAAQDFAQTIAMNPVSTARDAEFKYEGIAITRPVNTIDDVIPDVTLTLHGTTGKTAVVTIGPETQGAKDTLITFVGRYNQTIAEINILTQNKGEIISELEYLSEDERAEAAKRLGMFQGDSTLSTAKSSFQNIVTGRYAPDEAALVTMLAQIGISSRAAPGSAYTSASLRGYLEIDEKKLDEALKNNLGDIKNLFGYDSDGDRIIDSGLAYGLDQRLQAYTRSNGIISIKTSGIESSIGSAETKIKRLEEQLANRERQLKRQYGQMESTLNSLQGQADRITNFAAQRQRE
ncbi:MAG: flagellar filament capping protein FliD [Spirochaetaceae bacterium]|jgi:flagellar hook-associated protein 2|nr:flagellar filament capping protein FliD [Spirochaetaceae bacterium]